MPISRDRWNERCVPSEEDLVKQAQIVGAWNGRYSFGGPEQIDYISRRKADGTYLLRSRSVEPNGSVEIDEETGEWGVCGNRYFVLPKTSDGETIEFWEFPPRYEYEIISITEEEFAYRSAELEITFTAKRVAEDFDFPPP